MLQIFGVALLIPFFGWAVHLLRRRFVYYEENSLALEALTTVALGLFIWIEGSVLRVALGNQLLLYLFAMLGLLVSAFALYAHVLISLASRILVDVVAPTEHTATNQPRFGPVDALERSEDFEGALKEYLVLARIYPRNFEVLKRTARVQEILNRPDEAAVWYLRARKRAASASEALLAANRLCAIYDGDLAQPDEADRVLQQYLEDYPDSLDNDLVVERLERRANRVDTVISAQLQRLDDSPMDTAPDRVPPGEGLVLQASTRIPLVDLASAGATDAGNSTQGNVQTPAGAENTGRPRLESLEKVDVAGNATADPPAPRLNGRSHSKSGIRSAKAPSATPVPAPSAALEALDTIATGPVEEPARETVRPDKPRLSLEAMGPGESN